MTGFVSAIGLLPDFGFAAVMFASIMGGAGASFAADRFVHNNDVGKRFAIASQNQPCTFRLHEMFSHFTALTLLIAGWVWLYRLATTFG
jgi:hypothetical protein